MKRRHVAIGIATLALIASEAWSANEPKSSTTWSQAPRLSAVNSLGEVGRAPGAEGAVITIFDSFTGATPTTTGGAPRTFIAGPFVAAGPGTIAHIDEATVFFAATATFNCSNGIDIRVQVWDGFDGATSPVFSTAVGAVETFTVPGPLSFTLNTFTPIDIVFPVTRDLADLTGGWAVAYRCDNGAGLVSQDSATSLLRTTAALAVGSFPPNSGTYVSPVFGFYRNVANQTTFNHASTDLRTFAATNNIGIAVQLRGTLSPVELLSVDVE
jgi:hypothetical protein